MPEQRIDPRLSLAIQAEALRIVGREASREYILYIDERVLAGGTPLGPAHAGIQVRPGRATLVFVDEEPTAGFAHACRYLLFDPMTAALLDQHAARFPPYPAGWPTTYRRFGPRQPPHPDRRLRGAMRTPGSIALGVPGSISMPPGPGLSSPLSGGGRRLALFFAGSPDPSHLNTMEFGYRTLVNKLGYLPQDIRVASYYGPPTLTCAKWQLSGISPAWDGDDGPFTLPVHFAGIRDGFQKALRDLDPRSSDTLFIHTSGHGENENRSSYLSTAYGEQYTARQFKKDLQRHSGFKELVVMMQQCNSGGFRHAVETSGAAGLIAFASAAAWNTRAYNDQDNDLNFTWSSFARDWFGAQNGGYFKNSGLSHDPDAIPAGNADHHVAAIEAFRYAKESPFAHPLDRPQDGYRPNAVQSSQQLRLDGT